MATFNILIGADVRAYCRQEAVEAESRDEAIAKTVAWLEQRGHTPERIGFAASDEAGSEIQGEVSLTVDDDDDWIDIPTPDGNPNYGPLLAFVQHMARMEPVDTDDASEVCDETLMSDASALWAMIRKAREIVDDAEKAVEAARKAVAG